MAIVVGFDKLKPYALMVFLQFGSAGMYIISLVTLNRGMNRYVLIVYRNAIAALFLAPFALVLERKVRPKMSVFNTELIFMTCCMVFNSFATGKPVLDQGFTYLGMKYTSASYASAIMNAVPSVTFVIAVIFRLERINIKKIHSQAKVIGTVVTLGGTLLMTLYKGPVINLIWSSTSSHHENSSSGSSDNNNHWVAGTLFIMLGCVAWSCFFVLQSITVKKYPAELSLSALICFSGTLQSAVIALAMERRASGWAVGWDSRLYAPIYSGIVRSGIAYYVQGLVLKTRGPVFVTAFNPLCMIIVAILGSIILAEKIHLGSIIGGIIITVGLYAVIWGKSKDYSASSAPPTTAKDAQELPISSKSNATIEDLP